MIVLSLQAYNVALEIYDLVQLEDVLVYLKKKFIEFKTNEKKCTGEIIYFKHFEGKLVSLVFNNRRI